MNSSCSHCTINLLRTVEMNRRFCFSFGLFVSRNGVCPPLWIAHGYVKSANMAEKIAFGEIFLQKGRFYGSYKHLIPPIYPPEMNKQKFYNKSAERNVKIGLMNGAETCVFEGMAVSLQTVCMRDWRTTGRETVSLNIY